MSLDGAVGFGVRGPEIYVFKAGAAVCTGGGALDVRRPQARAGFAGATMPSVLALIITG